MSSWVKDARQNPRKERCKHDNSGTATCISLRWGSDRGNRRLRLGIQLGAGGPRAIDRGDPGRRDAGINLIDTAAFYGLGHSEKIVAKAIDGISERPYVFTKCERVWNAQGEPGKALEGRFNPSAVVRRQPPAIEDRRDRSLPIHCSTPTRTSKKAGLRLRI